MTQTSTAVTFQVEWTDKPMTTTNRCGYCFAPAGRPCTTRKGKATARLHNGRAIGPVSQ